MSPWRLIFREILHRRLNFVLAVVSVWVAAGVLVAELTLLARHDRNTEAIVAHKQAQTGRRIAQRRADLEASAAKLNDDMRKIMKQMGFNVLILPKDQDLGDFFSDGYASRFMPESYVSRLADSRIITVRHLLPILERKVRWSEQGGRKIVLVGTRGEVPIAHKTPKKPILDPVLPGQIVMGYELWNGLSLNLGAKVKLLGRQFTVVKRHGERGTKDDITAWINLAEAQEMLNLQGKINAILALECRCAWADPAQVRVEITRILPETQVKEIHSKALARAEARRRAHEQGVQALRTAQAEGRQAIAQEQSSRARLRQEIETFASIIIPVTVVGGAAWVCLLAYINVRRRRREVGILRAIGVRSRLIAGVFLARAVLLGLVGGALGCVAGLIVASVAAEAAAGQPSGAGAFSPSLLVAVLLAAPALCAVASWAPAMWAGRQDPALVLQEE